MRLLIAAFLALVVNLAGAADNPALRTSTFALEFPTGWQLTQDRQRAEGHGPDGEFIIVNTLHLPVDAPPELVDKHWALVRGFAAGQMPGIAASHQNDVRRPLTETALPGGRVQFSTVSQSKRLFRDYYFLQYLLGSPRTMVYMTIERYGNAEEAAQRFERVLATQQWTENAP
jgi:hypothetical protein